MVKKNKVVLVVVAHQDDETIGMGGTISNHVKNGDKVFCINMTNGVGSRISKKGDKEKRENAALNASNILGFEWLPSPNFPDNSLDTVSLLQIIRVIEDAKGITKPDIVYTHSGADLNIDHRLVFQATLTAFRPEPSEVCCKILSFEVPSATDYSHNSISPPFLPNFFVEISKEWKNKELALGAY